MGSSAAVVLHPGDLYFGDAVQIGTLLGSCVAIALWHPRRRIGGMCHYLVPSRGKAAAGQALSGRYADEAMRLLLHHVYRHCTRPAEYQVGMFGGGYQFPTAWCGNATDVPRMNVVAGHRLLSEAGFVLNARHVGGLGFRQVTLDLATGEMLVDYSDRGDGPGPAGDRRPDAAVGSLS
jgi:chemotaxis protein CheD